MSAAERDELARLRRENKQLRLERDILSCAAAWSTPRGVLQSSAADWSRLDAEHHQGCPVGLTDHPALRSESPPATMTYPVGRSGPKCGAKRRDSRLSRGENRRNY